MAGHGLLTKSSTDRRRLQIGVCSADRSHTERISAAIEQSLDATVVEGESVEGLIGTNGDPPEWLIVGTRRLDRSVIESARPFRSEWEGVHKILVCDQIGGAHLRRALEVGFDGVLRTADLETALVAVIAAVQAGQVSVPSENREEIAVNVLTGREKQVLGLVVMGLTNAEIAGKLFLAESTVKSHLSSAFAKLGVSSRNEAVTLILDPERGRALGILTIPAEPVPTP